MLHKLTAGSLKYIKLRIPKKSGTYIFIVVII